MPPPKAEGHVPCAPDASRMPGMEFHNRRPDAHSASADDFATTLWSLVLAAGQRGITEAEHALAVLCQRYWFPLYAFERRRVSEVHEAQDLTQEFFLRLLDKNSLAATCPERSRFRSFLLASLKHFLANEWDRTTAQK